MTLTLTASGRGRGRSQGIQGKKTANYSAGVGRWVCGWFTETFFFPQNLQHKQHHQHRFNMFKLLTN